MEKIVKVSHLFRIIFLLGFIILPCLTILSWWLAPTTLHIGSENLGLNYNPIPEEFRSIILTPLIKLLGFLTELLVVLPNMLLLFFLQRLFAHYQHQKVFTAENVKLIRNIGFTLIVWQILTPVHQALLSVLLTLNNPPGQHILEISFSGNNLAVILIAVMVILISWIMSVGHKLQEESDYTV